MRQQRHRTRVGVTLTLPTHWFAWATAFGTLVRPVTLCRRLLLRCATPSWPSLFFHVAQGWSTTLQTGLDANVTFGRLVIVKLPPGSSYTNNGADDGTHDAEASDLSIGTRATVCPALPLPRLRNKKHGPAGSMQGGEHSGRSVTLATAGPCRSCVGCARGKRGLWYTPVSVWFCPVGNPHHAHVRRVCPGLVGKAGCRALQVTPIPVDRHPRTHLPPRAGMPSEMDVVISNRGTLSMECRLMPLSPPGVLTLRGWEVALVYPGLSHSFMVSAAAPANSSVGDIIVARLHLLYALRVGAPDPHPAVPRREGAPSWHPVCSPVTPARTRTCLQPTQTSQRCAASCRVPPPPNPAPGASRASLLQVR